MDVIVKTNYGEVRGSRIDGVNIFKGIPYAAPPFGPNRFQPPQPVEPWSGVRDALTYGPTVPKLTYPPPINALFPDITIEGADCLNLNIWSPDLGQSRLPVMFWIHGGFFEYGSSAEAMYDGAHFARDGVVFVSINYRLGVDGFLYLGDDNSNLGLLDQVAALKWVQENIAAFGGDPNNITIFGESAGGWSVSTLLSMPHAAGLFRRAIAQSGAGHHVLSADTAQRIGRYLAEKLSVEPTREAIAAVPIDRLLQAEGEVCFEVSTNPKQWGEAATSWVTFGPVVDGNLLPARPIDSIAAGTAANIDVLIGTNDEEWRFMLVTTGTINTINQDNLISAVAAYGLPVPEALTAYRTTRKDATPGDLLSAVITDWSFRIPAIRLAEAHTPGIGATYMYDFGWRSLQSNGQLGACHLLELPFVFDNLDKKEYASLMGCKPSQNLADAMHRAWIAFATNGDPGWPQYDLKRRATMHFDITSEIVDDPRSAERILWEGRR